MGRERLLLRIGSVMPSSTLTPTHIQQFSDNISVLTADTTAEAIEILDTESVDCVICEPPEPATGVEWVTQIRAKRPELPVFLVINNGTESTVEAAIEAGVTDCVVPPLSETDRRLLDNRLRTATEAASEHRSTPSENEQQLASEADYQSLVEDVLGVSYVGTFVLDSGFSVVWINDAVRRYFGVDSDIIGQDKRTLIEGRIKHIFEDPERFADRVIATYDDNTYVERFECHVTPDGDRAGRWLEHWSYPITTGPYEGGRIEHYVDITARKQRERELESERQLLDRLFETSPTGVLLLDSDGEISRANSHGEVVLGLSQSALTDRSYDDPNWEIHDAEGEPIPSDELPFAVVKRTGEPVFGYEHGITLADGTDRWLSVSASPLLADDGSVDRVICVVVDITATRETESALAAHNEQLEEFASIVSHDLRNPLNVLAGSIELAEETGETAHFERAQRAVDRMSQLIDDLLLLARAGQAIDATEPVDIGALAEDCWQTLSAERATLSVETDLVVVADKSRLTQLFENLFRNAVEHGGDAITLTVGALSDGFFVADDGLGVQPDYREQLFERGVSSTREGTGLGLHIVSEIADAHGWRVGLGDSDTGTRIEVTGVEQPADSVPQTRR